MSSRYNSRLVFIENIYWPTDWLNYNYNYNDILNVYLNCKKGPAHNYIPAK